MPELAAALLRQQSAFEPAFAIRFDQSSLSAALAWRALTDRRPETYRDIPALGRPTPYQLFNPHPRVFDFLVVPALRDLMCGKQNPDVRWLSEGIATIVCEWNAPVEDALAFNDITGELDLTIAARVGNLRDWRSAVVFD